MSEKKYDVYVGNDKVGEVWGESARDIEAKYAAREWNRERMAREAQDPEYRRKNNWLRARATIYGLISIVCGLALLIVLFVTLDGCMAGEESALSIERKWWIGGCAAGWLVFKILKSIVEDDYYSR